METKYCAILSIQETYYSSFCDLWNYFLKSKTQVILLNFWGKKSTKFFLYEKVEKKPLDITMVFKCLYVSDFPNSTLVK